LLAVCPEPARDLTGVRREPEPAPSLVAGTEHRVLAPDDPPAIATADHG
jgi:hypothetical protein